MGGEDDCDTATLEPALRLSADCSSDGNVGLYENA